MCPGAFKNKEACPKPALEKAQKNLILEGSPYMPGMAYTYIYIYRYICMYIYIYTHIRTSTYTCLYIYIYIYIYVYIIDSISVWDQMNLFNLKWPGTVNLGSHLAVLGSCWPGTWSTWAKLAILVSGQPGTWSTWAKIVPRDLKIRPKSDPSS